MILTYMIHQVNGSQFTCLHAVMYINFTDNSLSMDGTIAIGSLISVFILTSPLFLIFRYLCGLYHQKLR